MPIMHSFMASFRSSWFIVDICPSMYHVWGKSQSVFPSRHDFFAEKTLDKRGKSCYSIAIMKKNAYIDFFDWRWCRR